MGMLQMQRIYLCALKKDRKQILELLQRRGVVEIYDDIPEDNVFKKSDVSKSEALFNDNIKNAEEALNIIKPYVKNTESMILSMVAGRKDITQDIYDNFSSKYHEITDIVKTINNLYREIAENKAQIIKIQTQIDMLSPWIDLDIPINFTGTKHTSAFIGTLPNERDLEALYELLAEHMPVHIDIISKSKEQTSILVIAGKENKEQISEILRSEGFTYPSISIEETPTKQIKLLNERINELSDKINDANEKIKDFADYYEDLKFLHDYESMRKEKYKVIGELLQSDKVFMLSGYIPYRDSKELQDILNEKYDIIIELEEPSEEEDVPVVFNNNGFSAPVEGTIISFSPPGKGEMDPTSVMSIFFYFFFGLMLSDAGYGLLMAVACGFILAKYGKKIERPLKNTLKMYLFCGISTIFWGMMFSSYFGDLVDVIAKYFFNKDVTIPPLWFIPVNEPMKMLAFSMLFGIIHLFAGLAMKAYQSIKQKDYKSLIYDVVFWYMLLIGLIVLLLSMDMIKDILGVTFIVPSTMIQVFKVISIIGAVGIVLTNGRESRNPFKRFLKGLYALYGVSGYLGDVLSYSRLLALGLATGIICNVINQMATMAGTGVIGAIAFIVIVVVGHALNFAINALGAYVHTSRLQYVEFFGKFYEGGGKMFTPFSTNTKYFKFKEGQRNG